MLIPRPQRSKTTWSGTACTKARNGVQQRRIRLAKTANRLTSLLWQELDAWTIWSKITQRTTTSLLRSIPERVSALLPMRRLPSFHQKKRACDPFQQAHPSVANQILRTQLVRLVICRIGE